MRPAILLLGVLLLSAQAVLAEDVTNTYTDQGGGDKDCGAPPPGVWTQISADNAGYPCGASPLGVFLCDCDAMPSLCAQADLDYWSYIVHGHVTLGTQVEMRASDSCADSGTCAGSSTSITLQKPTEVNGIFEAVQPNDIMVTQLTAYTSGTPLQPPTPPAGSTWTQITSTGMSAEQEWVFYHIAGSSEPSSYTWTFDTTVEAAAGGIADYANVNTSNPWNTSGGVFSSNSTTITCPSVNATANEQLLCFMATFTGIDPGNLTGLSTGFPGLILGERWLLEYPSSPPGLIDAALFDEPIKDTGTYSVIPNISPSADNAGISVTLNPAPGSRTVSTVEVQTYIGGGGGICQSQGSTVTCAPGYKLLEDSTYAMPAANSLTLPFDAAEFNLPSHASMPGDGNFQAFYVFAKPTGGTVSCADSYITHETN